MDFKFLVEVLGSNVLVRTRNKEEVLTLAIVKYNSINDTNINKQDIIIQAYDDEFCDWYTMSQTEEIPDGGKLRLNVRKM